MKHFYNSNEIKNLLDLNSRRTANYRIQVMNAELESQGFWTEPGKVPKKFFHEKYPYLPMEKDEGSASD